jgi:hypothetical protein
MERTQRNRLVIYGVVGLFVLFLIIWTAVGNMDSPLSAEGMGMWLAAFLSLCILSFLYDDNPFYKFAEHLFIGISAAYYMVLAVWDEIIKHLLVKLWPEVVTGLVEGVDTSVGVGTRLWYLMPTVLGFMLLWRLAPKGGWIARWPLAFIVGWAAGTNLVRFLVSDFKNQIDPTFVSLIVIENGSVDWIAMLSAFVTVFGLLAALIYFFFSVEHKGAFGAISKVGIWILMITFGAAFAYTVMGRIALLVGRMEFMFVDWMQIIQH